MQWATRFSLRQKASYSLWLIPLLGAIVGVAVSLGTLALDREVTLPFGWTFSSSSTEILLVTIAGAMIGLLGFVITVTVLMVQTASSGLSPRYLRLLYRGRLLKVVLAFLVGTFAYSYVLLRHAEDKQPPEIGVFITGLLVLAGIVLFLVFLSRFLHRLRPVVAVASVASLGERAFVGAVRSSGGSETDAVDATPGAILVSSRSGMIQAVDVDGLVSWARAGECLLVLSRSVGDYVPVGGALVELRGVEPRGGVRDEIEGMIALGEERTIEQDPAFAIRVMVDIAARALSPGINDPTTAVQVLDHLENMLVLIGSTDLSARGVFSDEAGTPRLVVPTRDWEDFLTLGVTEIRHFGASSIQVLRRLRALLLQLQDSVRPEHGAAVERELARLDETVIRSFGGSLDLEAAASADSQGLGGPAA